MQASEPRASDAAGANAATGQAWPGDPQRLLAALGGRENVRGVQTAASRLRVSVGDAALVDRATLGTLGLRGVAVPLPGCVHLIIGPAAVAAGEALRRLLAPTAE
jgi:phosphotransferase system IIB component